MDTKIVIVAILLLVFLSKGSAQEYYSKIIRGIEDRTYVLRTHLAEEEDKLVIPMARIKTTGSDVGWLLTDLYGEAIDSFFYKELHAPASNNISLLKGDTLFMVLMKPTDQKEIYVFGSSVSRRDSLFKWVYDMSELVGSRYLFPQSVALNGRGNLVILSCYYHAHVSLHMLEVAMDGEVVLDKVIHTYNDVFGASHSSRSHTSAHILEKDGLYYTLQVVGLKYRVICFDSEGNMLWVTEPRKELTADPSRDNNNDISFRYDSTELYVAHFGRIELEDFFPEDEQVDSVDYIRLFLDTVENFYYERMQISVYDLNGEELRRHSQFLRFLKGERISAQNVFSSKTSRYNGDLMVVGTWKNAEDNSQFQYNMGFYFRMSPDGEDVQLYKVLDRFGHPHIFGAGLRGITEDSEGNVYLDGYVHNSWKPPYQNAGWLVRLGVDPCEGMHCRGDTLSGHTFLVSSDEIKVTGWTTEYLRISPNPAQSGSEIMIGRRGNEEMNLAGDILLLSGDGVTIRRYRSEELLSTGGRLVLPSYLPPGTYYLNMRKRDSLDRYVGKVVVAK